MKKSGPREAQLRAMREAQFEERQRQARKPAIVSRPKAPRSETAQLHVRPSPNASPNTAYARNLRWRIKNRDRYNATMRDLMRKIRAERRKAAA